MMRWGPVSIRKKGSCEFNLISDGDPLISMKLWVNQRTPPFVNMNGGDPHPFTNMNWIQNAPCKHSPSRRNLCSPPRI